VLYADTTAPASVSDATKRSLMHLTNTNADSRQLPFPQFLPAGVGLFQASSVAGCRSAGTYDLQALT
jgi:hypothetical protein